MPLIAVSGTQGVGKSTFISDFLKQFPMYKTPKETYRDYVKKNNLDINKTTTVSSQRSIMEFMIKQMDSYSKKEYVIFDRCILDNIVYTLWAYEKGLSDITDEFIEESIFNCRRQLQRLDLIILIPLVKTYKIDLVEDDLRCVDPVYQKEINSIFMQFKRIRDQGDDAFFVRDDSPPIIDISGTREERIEMIKLYVKENGGFYGEEDSLLYDALGMPIGIGNSGNIEPDIDSGEINKLLKQLENENKDKRN